jgi:transcriptional regulator with XRE-family HTH domain
MSQEEVGSLLGCSRKRISEFELGIADVSFKFVESYCSILGAAIEFVPSGGDSVDFPD